MSVRFVTPEEVEAAFYRAFQELDQTLMTQVWSDDPDTVCVHPGGDLLRGNSSVIQSWIEVFSGARCPTLVYRAIQETADGTLAVHLVEEMIRPGGQQNAEASRVLATNVYRRGRNGWRMLVHHASLPVVRSRRGDSVGRLH